MVLRSVIHWFSAHLNLVKLYIIWYCTPTALLITHSDSYDQLSRSHIMQYHCSFSSHSTMGVLWCYCDKRLRGYCTTSSCRVTSQYPQQYSTVHLYVCTVYNHQSATWRYIQTDGFGWVNQRKRKRELALATMVWYCVIWNPRSWLGGICMCNILRSAICNTAGIFKRQGLVWQPGSR